MTTVSFVLLILLGFAIVVLMFTQADVQKTAKQRDTLQRRVDRLEGQLQSSDISRMKLSRRNEVLEKAANDIVNQIAEGFGQRF